MIFSRLLSRPAPAMRHILLHSHLFKNAGSTIDWALQRSFGAGFVDHRDDKDMHRGRMKYLHGFLEAHRKVVAVSSHQMPFDPEYQAPGFTFWFMLMIRDPIARALSVYEYEKSQPERVSLGAKMAKRMSMREYFDWRLRDDAPAVIRDFHVRSLCDRRHRPKHVLGEADLLAALERARLPRVLVGFVERFDESMVQFEAALQPAFRGVDLAHVIQNRRRGQAPDPQAALRDGLGEALYAELCEKNGLDRRLHAALLQQFELTRDKMDGFDACLRAFKGRCAELH